MPQIGLAIPTYDSPVLIELDFLASPRPPLYLYLYAIVLHFVWTFSKTTLKMSGHDK